MAAELLVELAVLAGRFILLGARLFFLVLARLLLILIVAVEGIALLIELNDELVLLRVRKTNHFFLQNR